MSVDQVKGMRRRDTLVVAAASAAASLIQPTASRAAAVAIGSLRIGRGQPFDEGWRFRRGTGEGFENPGYDDSGWRSVDLPHDWSIEDLPTLEHPQALGPFTPDSIGGPATAYTVGGEGWYRRAFRMDGLPPGAQVEVGFGGAYTETDVWLNGRHLGRHVHGYTPFAFDLTPHLQPRTNVLAVRVRNLGKNSRWYSGSGIYRSVTMDVTTEAARVARWGVGVSTRRITDRAAEIEVETRLLHPAPDLVLVSRVRDAAGRIVAEASSAALELVRQTLTVERPALWSPSSPALYTLQTELRRGSQVIDTVSNSFGVRIVTFDAERGMQINGVATKLRGGCVHHDNGFLGAAAYPDAEDRRVRLLKARGYNAIRSSHNPSSRAFLEACDRHGMLLIEEAFDMWKWPKNPDDYAKDFSQWAEADVAAMVLAARNHPSVVMWSIGNEVPERNSVEGVEIAWRLANTIHKLDPTRPVTAGVNGFAGRPAVAGPSTARSGFAGVLDEPSTMFLDVAGYNYNTLERYAADHARFPQRVMYSSESFPKDLFSIWEFAARQPYMVGDFVWTAMDYLGEAGIGNAVRNKSKAALPTNTKWPWIAANCGDLDLSGRQRAQSLARDVAWGLSELEMVVQRPLADGVYEHVSNWGWSDELQSWTWPGFEGRSLNVRVYSKAERVDLRLNGQVIGTKTKVSGEPRLEFQAPYAPGVLEAVAYQNGRPVARRRLESAGAPIGIQIRPEPLPRSKARGRLAYVWIEIIDSKGRVTPGASRKVRLAVSGPAVLAGFGSANPFANGSYQSSQRETFEGRALAILRFDGRLGPVRIQAESDGLARGISHLRAT
jgi:beta-galactosidase